MPQETKKVKRKEVQKDKEVVEKSKSEETVPNPGTVNAKP